MDPSGLEGVPAFDLVTFVLANIAAFFLSKGFFGKKGGGAQPSLPRGPIVPTAYAALVPQAGVSFASPLPPPGPFATLGAGAGLRRGPLAEGLPGTDIPDISEVVLKAAGPILDALLIAQGVTGLARLGVTGAVRIGSSSTLSGLQAAAQNGQDIIVLGRFGRHLNKLRELANRIGGRILDRPVKNVDRYILRNIKRADQIVVRTTNVTPLSYTFKKELPWIGRYMKKATLIGPLNKYIEAFFRNQ